MDTYYKPNSVYIPKALGVKEYSFDEEINVPFRQSMEDSKRCFPIV